jgi:hypothetical protein
MQVFLMHIGHPGHVDVQYTVTRRRSFDEVLEYLPPDAPETNYFRSDPELHAAFPDGTFNCWGVPSRAEPSFLKTEIGDLVLIVPWIGVHGGGIQQIGLVRAKCPIRCYAASRILWPDTPKDRLFPFIFFFNSEIGFRSWFTFLDDLGIAENWHPRGWYRQIKSSRFVKRGGPDGYLRFLRDKCGFKERAEPRETKPMFRPTESTPEELLNGMTYPEGAAQQILVNRYERNPKARQACIDHYGATWSLCAFDFGKVYGELMDGFIHVHHLASLAALGHDYQVDPIKDLRPVCPNCHAVLHRTEPAMPLAEAKRLLQQERPTSVRA